jgi:hypothetical protein
MLWFGWDGFGLAGAVPVELWSLLLFRSVESRYGLDRHYLCNNYTLFMLFGYL